MTLYICQYCHRINAPKPPEAQLLFCWTCGGAVVVVSDLLPFDDYCQCEPFPHVIRYDGEKEYCGVCEKDINLQS